MFVFHDPANILGATTLVPWISLKLQMVSTFRYKLVLIVEGVEGHCICILNHVASVLWNSPTSILHEQVIIASVLKFDIARSVSPELPREWTWFNGNIFWCSAKTFSDDEGCLVDEIILTIINNGLDVIGPILDACKGIFCGEAELVVVSNWIWNQRTKLKIVFGNQLSFVQIK